MKCYDLSNILRTNYFLKKYNVSGETLEKYRIFLFFIFKMVKKNKFGVTFYNRRFLEASY